MLVDVVVELHQRSPGATGARYRQLTAAMRYEPPISRPPSEARSDILQATMRTSWNNFILL